MFTLHVTMNIKTGDLKVFATDINYRETEADGIRHVSVTLSVVFVLQISDIRKFHGTTDKTRNSSLTESPQKSYFLLKIRYLKKLLNLLHYVLTQIRKKLNYTFFPVNTV